MSEMKSCPYCAEQIRAEAVRCRYCRSRLDTFDGAHWHRDHPEARIAGVSSAVAHALGVPLTAVRLGFVILTFVHLVGPLIYLGLWLVIPQGPGLESLAEGLLRQLWQLARRTRGVAPEELLPPVRGEGADSAGANSSEAR